MAEDWRFQGSPHVEVGGLRAYAGVPLRFETEFGEHVCFGSLCVASNDPQEPLSRAQQTALVRLADWIVNDIVHSARARRQRERRRMQELLSNASKLCDCTENVEEVVLDVLKQVYSEATITIQKSDSRRLVTLDGRDAVPYSDFDNGLWEDVDHFDSIVTDYNHKSMLATRHVRVIAAECNQSFDPTYLVVASKDFSTVFDDIDYWLVDACASLLSRCWQNRALQEALAVKETFLRGIAHQLRTPIHGILGSTELLAEDLKARDILDLELVADASTTPSDIEAPNLYSYIKSIKTSARELIATVNSMIKINQWTISARSDRVISLHHIEEFETALLNEVLHVVPDDYNRRPSIILNRHLPSNCDSLVVDLKLLIDCISPLVINAIQNTIGGVVAIATSLSDDYQSIIVDVEDTGCGIAIHDQQRIYDAYTKLDEHSTRAGLGLTLASRLATLMDGSVTLVSSTVGEGSHFRTTFNINAACSNKPPESDKQRPKNFPSTFCRLPSTPSSPLDRHLSNYLANHGFTQSDDPSTPFVLLDFSSNLSQLREGVPHIDSNKVALCLMPDFAENFVLSEERVHTVDNIVYVKAPFLPRVLEEGLKQAQHIFATLRRENGGVLSKQLDDVNTQLSNTSLTELSNGTMATELLPVEATKDPTVSAIQNLAIETQLSPPPKSLVVRTTRPMTLLVDDNAVNLRLLQMYCKRRKIPYCTAKNGKEAVSTFQQYASTPPSCSDSTGPIELVLMDLQMPVCDGLEATRQIRALEKEHGWPSSLISIVTGQDSPADRLGAVEAGAQGFLTKPVGPKILDNKIKQWFPGLSLDDGSQLKSPLV